MTAFLAGLLISAGLGAGPASAQSSQGLYWQCVAPSSSVPNGGYCPVNNTYPLPVTLTGTLLGVVQQIGQAGIPLVLSGSCTMTDNGAASSCPVLPRAYAASYSYWPANAICTSNAAGWYYTVWSTTSAATIYNNTYSSGTPAIPASPTAFVCTAGTGTQGTGADITAYSYTVPAATAAGINDSVWFSPSYSFTSSGNNKIVKSKVGTVPTVLRNVTVTTVVDRNELFGFTNAGIATRQVSTNSIDGAVGASSATNPLIYLGLDMAVNQTFIVTLQLANVADSIVLERIGVEVHKGVP